MKNFLHKEGTRSVLASLISILIGLVAGSILILVVGLTTKGLGLKSAWEGIQLVFFGLFSTGRNASGALTFGFNPSIVGNMLFRATPVILTGLSVAVAFKTGLFNIGAPGQYLAGTTVTLLIALSIPTGVGELAAYQAAQGIVPAVTYPTWFVWTLAFLGGLLAGAAGSLYYLSGNTEFFWSTYQQLPAVGFNGIPVALLASNHPIGVIFAGMFMSMLDIAGLQLTNLTAYNEYITDVIIAVIVYLAAFSLVIRMWLSGSGKRRHRREKKIIPATQETNNSENIDRPAGDGKEAAEK